MKKTIEVDGLAEQAIAVACEDARSSGLPRGHRCALPSFPEACLLIDKSGGRILQKHLSR